MCQWPPTLLVGGSVVAIAREEVDFNIFTLHELSGLSNQRSGGLCSQECLEQPTLSGCLLEGTITCTW